MNFTAGTDKLTIVDVDRMNSNLLNHFSKGTAIPFNSHFSGGPGARR
jgi:hypothetical protein